MGSVSIPKRNTHFSQKWAMFVLCVNTGLVQHILGSGRSFHLMCGNHLYVKYNTLMETFVHTILFQAIPIIKQSKADNSPAPVVPIEGQNYLSHKAVHKLLPSSMMRDL